MSQWWVYMARCADGTLYTGVTTDLQRREREHNTSPRGAKYTHSRRPVVFIAARLCSGRGPALTEEHSIKQGSRASKAAWAARHPIDRSWPQC